MDRMVTFKKRLIITALAVLLLGDLALAGYSWHAASTTRRSMAELIAEGNKLKLLAADVDRADRIRHDLPTTIAECERFESTLLHANAGNSAVTAELDDLAKKSGLQIQAVTFRQKELVGRNLTEVELEASVNGSYESIVKFMNGLQRSRNSYAVDSLALQTEGQNGANGLRVGLHLKTYFRTAA